VTYSNLCRNVLSMLALFAGGIATAEERKPAPKSLDGMQFKSVELLVGGALPNGVAMAHWTLKFTGTEFAWHHTDVIEIGNFTWDSKTSTVTATGLGAPDRKYTGKYDPATKTLTWQGKKYALLEAEKPKSK